MLSVVINVPEIDGVIVVELAENDVYEGKKMS